jgi:RND family efflux transporter MFP subunit
MRVEPGSAVTAGQVLATLDAGTMPAQVQQAQAALDAAEARLAQLHDGATQAQLATASQAVLTAQNALTAAQASLDSIYARTRLGSEIDAARTEAERVGGHRTSARAQLDAAVQAATTGSSAAATLVREDLDELDSVLHEQCDSSGKREDCTVAALASIDFDGLLIAVGDPTRVTPIVERLQRRVTADQYTKLQAAAFPWLQAGAALPGLNARVSSLIFAAFGNNAALPTASEIATATRTRDAAQAALTAAQAQVDTLRAGPTSADDLAARAAVSVARAGLATARAGLDQTSIVAPFDGVIVQRLSDVGASVSPLAPVFVLAAHAVEIRLTVDEARVGQLRPDLSADATAPAYPGQVFSGRVTTISATGDPRAHTFQVTILVADPGDTLRPGMSADVSIVTERSANAMLIPTSAVIDSPGGPAVYVVTDDKATLRRIKTGLADHASTAVLEGLTSSDRIVTVGQHLVRDGQAVRIVASEARTGS